MAKQDQEGYLLEPKSFCAAVLYIIMGNWAALYNTPSSQHSNHFKPSSKQVTTIAVGPCLAMETLPIQNKE